MPTKKEMPVREWVYCQIKEALMAGSYLPGQRIKLKPTADALGVSITPIHEALRRLVAEHGLEIELNRSVRVPVLTSQEVLAIREVRVRLEGYAVELAAQNSSKDLLNILYQIQLSIVSSRSRSDYAQMLKSNFDFHFSIYRQCGVKFLPSMIESLWMRSAPSLSLLYRVNDNFISRSDDHHVEIVRAIAARDGSSASQALQQDIVGATGAITRILDESQKLGGSVTMEASPKRATVHVVS
jgi:DNA-binding GntR family transcriptional regulator